MRSALQRTLKMHKLLSAVLLAISALTFVLASPPRHEPPSSQYLVASSILDDLEKSVQEEGLSRQDLMESTVRENVMRNIGARHSLSQRYEKALDRYKLPLTSRNRELSHFNHWDTVNWPKFAEQLKLGAFATQEGQHSGKHTWQPAPVDVSEGRRKVTDDEACVTPQALPLIEDDSFVVEFKPRGAESTSSPAKIVQGSRYELLPKKAARGLRGKLFGSKHSRQKHGGPTAVVEPTKFECFEKIEKDCSVDDYEAVVAPVYESDWEDPEYIVKKR